jgi:hypothetical protein
MGAARLPAHVEASALVRRVNAVGGFATIVAKGEPDAGTLLVVITKNGLDSRLYERMPQADGSRDWHLSRTADRENPHDFDEYLSRRRQQDPDAWIVELDVEDGERFIHT